MSDVRRTHADCMQMYAVSAPFELLLNRQYASKLEPAFSQASEKNVSHLMTNTISVGSMIAQTNMSTPDQARRYCLFNVSRTIHENEK